MTSEVIHSSDSGKIELITAENGKKRIRRTVNNEIPVYETLIANPSDLIPKIYSVEITDGRTIVEEEYSEGSSPLEAELSEGKKIKLMLRLCSAIEFIHSLGIVHNAVSPSDIIISEKGGIKLIDFGAARFAENQSDFRADIYAAGKTMETLLGSTAGKRKYAKIVRKCTESDPAKQYQTASQLRSAIGRTYPKRAILSAGAALMIAAAMLSSAMFYHPADSSAAPQISSSAKAELAGYEAGGEIS